MKKNIIILSVLLILLTSCGVEQKSNKTITQNNNQNQVIKTNSNNNFDKIKNTLDKLKNINLSKDKLSMINDFLENIYTQEIQEQALKSKNTELCNKLDKNKQDNCKEKVFIKYNQVKSCAKLSNSGAINNCVNTIFKQQALKQLNEKLCENIYDNSKEKIEIKNCKNQVLIKKAIKTLNSEICNKLTEPDNNVCKEEIKIKKETIEQTQKKK